MFGNFDAWSHAAFIAGMDTGTSAFDKVESVHLEVNWRARS
ncbi:hypothetical protein OG753_35430 [Streptomyces sp. NBC_00029]